MSTIFTKSFYFFPGSYTNYKVEGTYPNYSIDFFDDEHVVLRGGSWASTGTGYIRPQFRNFYQDIYGYVAAGFRLKLEKKKE